MPLTCVLLLAACGDDETTTAPAVLATTPVAGATSIAPTAVIGVAFTRPMDIESGALRVAGNLVTSLQWDTAGQAFTVTPALPFAAGAQIDVEVAGFTDLAGVAMSDTHVFSFGVNEALPAAPRITSTVPADGAASIGVDVSEIVVTFDSPMDTAMGAVTLFGPGVVSTVTWPSATQARIPIGGLRGDSSYALTLDGFRGENGVPLDPVPGVGNGRIEFATGADTVAPVVASSVPAEGDTAVEAMDILEIALVFDEPMDTSTGAATLSGYDYPVDLAVQWSEDGHQATLVLPYEVALRYEAAYSVELTAFRDVHGNALSEVVYLEDGHLDFAAGADTKKPRFLSSSIPDGATGVEPANWAVFQYDVIIEVSELLDPSAATATLEFEGETHELYIYANERRLQVGGVREARPLHSDKTYSIHITGLTDLAGNPIDTTGYLGDGRLDFTTGADTIAPFVAQATGIVEGRGSVGQVDVTPGKLIFSEPLDAASGVLELVRLEGASVTVLGIVAHTWDEETTTELAYELDNTLLANDQRFALRLTGFADREGNALDPIPLLGDGMLDFSVGASRPYFASPAPALRDVYPVEYYYASEPYPSIHRRKQFVVRFSEAMNTSITTLTLRNETTNVDHEVEVTWNAEGTEITFTVGTQHPVGDLAEDTDYALIFDHLTGADGLPVDKGSPHFLGAVLRFHTSLRDAQLEHTCGHLVFDTCQPTNALAVPTSVAPTTDSSHRYYSINLPASVEGGYVGYTSLRGNDSRDLLLYVREDVSLSVEDTANGFQLPLASAAAPAACPVLGEAGGRRCGLPGEVGITRIIRVHAPTGGTYFARWGADVPMVHMIAERAASL
jgi:hypothetical protein